jgi:phosphoglycerate dehydrogenase-like enzyme
VQGEELCGKTMGVLGVGNIGREIARKGRAFGMKVRGYDEVPVFIPYLDELYLKYQIEEFFSGLDVLVVAAALTAGSSGAVNRQLISLMNEGSYLINVARGPVVVEEDLIQALKEGPLAGAGLDVFREEPLPMDSELRRLTNVVLTPHIGGFNPNYAGRVLQVFVENFRRWLEQEPLINRVDTSQAHWHDEGRGKKKDVS